jgi:FixJ family two-component response regulator
MSVALPGGVRALIPKHDCRATRGKARFMTMTVTMAIQSEVKPVEGREDNARIVAIVDDDESVRFALKGMMKSVGLAAQAFASAEDFLNSGLLRQTACLIADIRMPGMSGLDLQNKLNAEHYRIPTIFITAHGDAQMRLQAMRSGAVEFLAKPFDDEVLLENVRAALES